MRFEDFAAARLPALLRYAALLCGDRELARDLVQDALIKALVRWKRIGAMDRPDAYVRTMITNEFLSLRRRKAVRTVALTHDTVEGPNAPRTPDHATVVVDDDLWRRLIVLPRQQRAVLVLRYYEGLSDDEIAETLDCRPGTVRAYASRALASLRVQLTTEIPRTPSLPPFPQGEPA